MKCLEERENSQPPAQSAFTTIMEENRWEGEEGGGEEGGEGRRGKGRRGEENRWGGEEGGGEEGE